MKIFQIILGFILFIIVIIIMVSASFVTVHVEGEMSAFAVRWATFTQTWHYTVFGLIPLFLGFWLIERNK